MIFGGELVSLILYATQQLGITLAVGGQTIVLVAYLLAMRDRVIDPTEAQFARAVRTVLVAGLFLVIASGLGVTAMHYFAGELWILLSPAYLFKWILVGAVALFTLGIGTNLVPQWLGEAFAGGTWYALFFLHILAPDTSWESLLILYGGWLGAFALCWMALVFGTRLPAQAGARTEKKTEPLVLKPVVSKIQPLPDIPSAKFHPTTQPPLRPLAGEPLTKPIPPKPVQPPAPPPPPPPKPVLPPAPPKPPAPEAVPLMQPKPLPSVTMPPVHIPMQKPEQRPAIAPAPGAAVPAIAQGSADLPAIRVMPKAPPTP